MLKQHAKLAEEAGIPKENIAVVENGQIIEFVDGEMRLGERIPGDYIFVDGTGVGDVDRSIVGERESLGRDGVLVINVSIDRNNGQLIGNPEVLSRGFMLSEEMEVMMGELQNRVKQAVKKGNGNLERDILRSLKSYLYQEIHRNPFIFVMVNQN
jgi:ribonuclease J